MEFRPSPSASVPPVAEGQGKNTSVPLTPPPRTLSILVRCCSKAVKLTFPLTELAASSQASNISQEPPTEHVNDIDLEATDIGNDPIQPLPSQPDQSYSSI